MQTAFAELATQQLKNAAAPILAIAPKNADEKTYQEGVEAALKCIETGKAHLLPQVMEEYQQNKKIADSLEVDHASLDYFFTIMVDNQHLIDIRVPSYGFAPKFTRERALNIMAEGPKHLPQFVKEMGKQFLYGVRLHTRGRWYVVEGLNIGGESKARNQEYEQTLLRSNPQR